MMFIRPLLLGAAIALLAADVQAANPPVSSSSRSGPSCVVVNNVRKLTPPVFARSAAFARRGGDAPEEEVALPVPEVLHDVPENTELSAEEESKSNSPKSIALSTKHAIVAGCILACNAGYINGACLSGILSADNTKQAAAAVTGAWTNSALGMASGNTQQFTFNAKCIGSYCSGSLLASLLNPNPVPFDIDVNAVSPAFLIASLLVYASSSVAKKSEGTNKAYIYLAATACGIQNSVTSVLTSNMVRSAHFSGITSDIGTFLGQVLRGNNTNALKLKVFSLLGLSFWMGGYVSFSVTKAVASSGLLFSSALFLLVALALMIA